MSTATDFGKPPAAKQVAALQLWFDQKGGFDETTADERAEYRQRHPIWTSDDQMRARSINRKRLYQTSKPICRAWLNAELSADRTATDAQLYDRWQADDRYRDSVNTGTFYHTCSRIRGSKWFTSSSSSSSSDIKTNANRLPINKQAAAAAAADNESDDDGNQRLPNVQKKLVRLRNWIASKSKSYIQTTTYAEMQTKFFEFQKSVDYLISPATIGRLVRLIHGAGRRGNKKTKTAGPVRTKPAESDSSSDGDADDSDSDDGDDKRPASSVLASVSASASSSLASSPSSASASSSSASSASSSSSSFADSTTSALALIASVSSEASAVQIETDALSDLEKHFAQKDAEAADLKRQADQEAAAERRKKQTVADLREKTKQIESTLSRQKPRLAALADRLAADNDLTLHQLRSQIETARAAAAVADAELQQATADYNESAKRMAKFLADQAALTGLLKKSV